jgi:hypothetical protein
MASQKAGDGISAIESFDSAAQLRAGSAQDDTRETNGLLVVSAT